MAHPDRPALPPPPPAMLARDTADMRAQLRNSADAIAASWQVTLAPDETGPGRRGYSGATVDAELAFALYREACRRGLHHSSTEAQAIADVSRFVVAADFVSLDQEAALERARIAGALVSRGSRILASLDADRGAIRCIVTGIHRDRLIVERLDGPAPTSEIRLDRFLVSWWLDRPDVAFVRLPVGDPARRAAPKAGTRRKAAASKSPARRRRKVG